MVSNASKSPGKRQVLIIHQNFPGQFRHVASALMERDDIELCAIAKEGAVGLPGVRCLHYKPHRQSKSSTHPYCRKMEDAVLHGQAGSPEVLCRCRCVCTNPAGSLVRMVLYGQQP